jgi:hypothetical protein
LGLADVVNVSGARVAYKQACGLDDQVGCANLSSLMLQGAGGPKDETTAVAIATAACKTTPEGCYVLGIFHMLRKEWQQSATLFESACDGYVAKACFNLGLHYLEGAGVAVSSERARQLFRSACEGGVAQGCAKLGKP